MRRAGAPWVVRTREDPVRRAGDPWVVRAREERP